MKTTSNDEAVPDRKAVVRTNVIIGALTGFLGSALAMTLWTNYALDIQHHGYKAIALGFASVVVVPVVAVLGALIGFCDQKKTFGAPTRGFAAVLGLVCICLAAATPLQQREHERKYEFRDGRLVAVNESGASVYFVTLAPVGRGVSWVCQAESLERNGRSDADSVCWLSYATPVWQPGLKLEVRWNRISKYDDSGKQSFRAEVPVPRYENRKRVLFIAYFLPDDQVCLDVANGEPSAAPLRLPAPGSVCIVKGERVEG